VRERRGPNRGALAGVLGAAFVIGAPSARAAAPIPFTAPAAAEHASDPAVAEALFQEGKRLLERGDARTACPKLAESLRLERATGTLLALAMCHEVEGRLASAWAEYAEVIARAKKEGRIDREQAARQWERALEPRLSTVNIAVPAAVATIPGLRVQRDGVALEAPAWSTAVPIDPGPHAVAASAPGRIAWATTVVVGAVADHQTVTVPLLALDERPAPDAAPPTLGVSAASPTTVAAAPARSAAPGAAVSFAALGGVAAESTSPTVGVDVDVVHPSGWGGGLSAAWLLTDRQQTIDSEGAVTVRSYALRACGFRRLRAARALTVTLGPELLLQLDRATTSGLGGPPASSRAAWGIGAQGTADLRVASWVSLSLLASADYAPSGWAGTLEVTNRGEVLRPSAFRLLVAAGPRFAVDW
jgi:hypothetical protein